MRNAVCIILCYTPPETGGQETTFCSLLAIYFHKTLDSLLFSGSQLLCLYNKILFKFSSVAQSCPTLCDPMNRSTPGLPVHHQFLESTQTHVR